MFILQKQVDLTPLYARWENNSTPVPPITRAFGNNLKKNLFKLKTVFFLRFLWHIQVYTYICTYTKLDFCCVITKRWKVGFFPEGLQFLEYSVFLPKHIGNILCEAKDRIYLIFSLAFEV